MAVSRNVIKKKHTPLARCNLSNFRVAWLAGLGVPDKEVGAELVVLKETVRAWDIVVAVFVHTQADHACTSKLFFSVYCSLAHHLLPLLLIFVPIATTLVRRM